MNKWLVTIFAVALVQVTYAQSVNDLANELRVIIGSKQANISINIGLQSKLITQTRQALRDTTSKAISNLRGQLIGLNDVAKTAITNASQQSKSIEQCIADEQAALSPLNIDDIRNCANSDILTLAGSLLGQLGAVQGDLGSAVRNCIQLSPLDLTEIRSCVDNALVDVDDSVNTINNEIQSLVNAALESTEECTKAEETQLNGVISDIEENLNKCVDAILNA
ncbi:hypothetical protein HHI36_010042 [Cryptolaemus montrouzieri]|uniref:Uncharacterized protein n=1 Tax=Cryptolaemus montrouzieri TaxID=559131 RepID=A0ABD2MHI0_9CUCU